jgi:DNA-binding response OmpR family regulator
VGSVLCINDQVPILNLRKMSLERNGFAVETASTISAALKLLEKGSVAVVLLEYKREGMDAEAVAFQIKRRFPAIPILLLSAYSDMSERILWLVDEYVMKSTPIDQLVGVITRMVRSQAAAA